MGQIQNSVNSMLSSSAQIATMAKALDILQGPAEAEKALKEVNPKVEAAAENMNKADEQAFTTQSALEGQFEDERGLPLGGGQEYVDFNGSQADQEEWANIQAQVSAAKAHAQEAATVYTQKAAFKQRLQDIKEGKNKASRTSVKKMMKKEGKENG